MYRCEETSVQWLIRDMQCYHRIERPSAEGVHQEVYSKLPRHVEKRCTKRQCPVFTQRIRS
jgi:hypothetical protein